jgi:hypothetical protein
MSEGRVQATLAQRRREQGSGDLSGDGCGTGSKLGLGDQSQAVTAVGGAERTLAISTWLGKWGAQRRSPRGVGLALWLFAPRRAR